MSKRLFHLRLYAFWRLAHLHTHLTIHSKRDFDQIFSNCCTHHLMLHLSIISLSLHLPSILSSQSTESSAQWQRCSHLIYGAHPLCSPYVYWAVPGTRPTRCPWGQDWQSLRATHIYCQGRRRENWRWPCSQSPPPTRPCRVNSTLATDTARERKDALAFIECTQVKKRSGKDCA